MSGTVFTSCLEGMKNVKQDDGQILAKPFLTICREVLPIIDKLGKGMSMVKSDVEGNILRLEKKYGSDPSEFNLLYNMVRAEVKAGTAKESSSCTNGLLWLTRAMDFLVELNRNLLDNTSWSMSDVCNDSYGKTLKKYHGWLASTSFNVAMKFAPNRMKFMEVLGGGEELSADMRSFCLEFAPLLEENHKFLESIGMNELKA